MFIKVHVEGRDGEVETQTLNISFIARVKTVNGKTVVAQHGMDYDVWAIEDKSDVDDMIREAGGKIAER